MTAAMTVDAPALLQELAALPTEQRLARLSTAGEPEAILVALCEESDRVTASEVAGALAMSELLLAMAQELGSPRALAEALGSRAMTLAYAGRLAESLAASAEAIAVAGSAGLALEAARARLASVHPLARLGRFDEAIAAGTAARDAMTALGERSLAARADVSLGAVYDLREEPAAALRHYDRALKELADDPIVVAQIETNRGIALMGLDEFSLAEEAFERAVGAFADGGHDWAAAIAEGNLAYLATRQGRLERALHHFERARLCLEADESPGDLARLLAEQADALASLGMPGEATDAYLQALPLLERHGLALEAAQARAGLGQAQLRLGRSDEAAATLALAAEQLSALVLYEARARLDVIRAELELTLGRLPEARLLAEDAFEALAPLPFGSALARELLARIDLADGDLAAAESQIEEALAAATRLDVAPLLARLKHLRGRIRLRRGNARAAEQDFRDAMELIERVRGALQAERYRTAFQGSQLAIYEDAILAALSGGDAGLAEAFATVERAKSRALLDLVGGALDVADAADRDASSPAEAALLAELAQVQRELNWHYSRPDDWRDFQRADIQADIRRLEVEYDALQDRLAVSRGLAGLFAPPLGLEESLHTLPAETALVEYFAAGEELMAFVLRDGHATVYRHLASLDQLEELVRRVHFQIGRGVASASRAVEGSRAERMLADARRELGELYTLLISPLAGDLVPAERLVIVPHGVLHTLPFHALWDGKRYLIESHEIVTAPSASVYAKLAIAPPSDGGKVPAYVAGVPDALAPWIANEANEVATLLGVCAMLGEDVTAEAFVRAAEPASIVHLACHGRFFRDGPLASGLKLADRWLTVRDVYRLRLRAELVALSGCDTGRALVSGGDELLGLMRGFLVAGAKALLISLWVANDESTTTLMTEFYRRYVDGAGAAAALRAAQRSQLAQRPHPAFWAPFVLGGNP